LLQIKPQKQGIFRKKAIKKEKIITNQARRMLTSSEEKNGNDQSYFCRCKGYEPAIGVKGGKEWNQLR
jgi:hypothetical protein